MILQDKKQVLYKYLTGAYSKLRYDLVAYKAFTNILGGFLIIITTAMFIAYWNGSELRTEHQERLAKNKITIPLAGIPAQFDENTKKSNKLPPFDGLYIKNIHGNIPVIDKNGMSAFKAYSHPLDGPVLSNEKIVSIIITNLGISKEVTGESIKLLPKEVTFSFSPYANKLNAQVIQAWSKGHDILIDMPLETKDFPKKDPGPLAMYTWVDTQKNINSLTKIMGSSSGYIGFLADSDSSYFNKKGEIRPLLGQIYERGLAFIEPYDGISEGRKLAIKNNSPYARIDMSIPSLSTHDEILQKLTKFEENIKKQKTTIVTLKAKRTSISALLAWTKTLPKKNIRIVPISVIAGQ